MLVELQAAHIRVNRTDKLKHMVYFAVALEHSRMMNGMSMCCMTT